jgi:hypothetical protein
VQEQAEILLSEISQLKAQWVIEVGEGRRKWPKSIKERVEQLDALGIPAKQVSQRTGIGYETLLSWRFARRQKFKKQFHQLEVKPASSKAIAKIDTVTVPKLEIPKEALEIGTVTVTTPDGFKIEALNVSSAISILKELRVR